MRLLILMLFSGGFAFAKGKNLVEITYKDRLKTHRYVLLDQSGKYALNFQSAPKVKKSKEMTRLQAARLQTEALRIIWKSKMVRNPSRCTKYVHIRLPEEQADICVENAETTGLSFALLNELHSLVH